MVELLLICCTDMSHGLGTIICAPPLPPLNPMALLLLTGLDPNQPQPSCCRCRPSLT